MLMGRAQPYRRSRGRSASGARVDGGDDARRGRRCADDLVGARIRARRRVGAGAPRDWYSLTNSFDASSDDAGSTAATASAASASGPITGSRGRPGRGNVTCTGGSGSRGRVASCAPSPPTTRPSPRCPSTRNAGPSRPWATLPRPQPWDRRRRRRARTGRCRAASGSGRLLLQGGASCWTFEWMRRQRSTTCGERSRASEEWARIATELRGCAAKVLLVLPHRVDLRAHEAHRVVGHRHALLQLRVAALVPRHLCAAGSSAGVCASSSILRSCACWSK